MNIFVILNLFPEHVIKEYLERYDYQKIELSEGALKYDILRKGNWSGSFTGSDPSNAEPIRFNDSETTRIDGTYRVTGVSVQRHQWIEQPVGKVMLSDGVGYQTIRDLIYTQIIRFRLSRPTRTAVGKTLGALFSEIDGTLIKSVLKEGCFAAGTPIVTSVSEDGQLISKPIEQLQVGDYVLSRHEDQPDSRPRLQQVEAVFVREATLLDLRIAGQLIRTTAEHPFFVQGKGWTASDELSLHELVLTHDGQWLPVEGIAASERLETVYNVRVAVDHTYFVGGSEWGFVLWGHNVVCVDDIIEALKVTNYSIPSNEILEEIADLLNKGNWSRARQLVKDTFKLSNKDVDNLLPTFSYKEIERANIAAANRTEEIKDELVSQVRSMSDILQEETEGFIRRFQNGLYGDYRWNGIVRESNVTESITLAGGEQRFVVEFVDAEGKNLIQKSVTVTGSDVLTIKVSSKMNPNLRH